MKASTLTCHSCGTATEFEGRLPHNSTCSRCASYLHCCLSCRFHDPSAYNECHEPQAARVKEKDKANFCEFFEIATEVEFRGNQKRKDDALDKLNNLFKK